MPNSEQSSESAQYDTRTISRRNVTETSRLLPSARAVADEEERLAEGEFIIMLEQAGSTDDDEVAQKRSILQMLCPWLKDSIRENPKLTLIMLVNVGATFPSYFSPAEVMSMITDNTGLQRFAGASGWGGNAVLRDNSLFRVVCAHEKGFLRADLIVMTVSAFTAISDAINSTLMATNIYNVCPVWLVKVFFGLGIIANYPVSNNALTQLFAHLSRDKETREKYEQQMAVGYHLSGRTVDDELLFLKEIIQYIEAILPESNGKKRLFQNILRNIRNLNNSDPLVMGNHQEMGQLISDVEGSDLESSASDDAALSERDSARPLIGLGAPLSDDMFLLPGRNRKLELRDKIVKEIAELDPSCVNIALDNYCMRYNLSVGASRAYKTIYYSGIGLCTLAAITLFEGNFSLYHRDFEMGLVPSILVSCIPSVAKAALYTVSWFSFMRYLRHLPDTVRNSIYMVKQDNRYSLWIGGAGTFLCYVAPSGIGFYLTPKAFLELLQCVMTSTCQQPEPIINNSTDISSTTKELFLDSVSETDLEMRSTYQNSTHISSTVVLTFLDILIMAVSCFFIALLWTFKIGVTSVGIMTNLNAGMQLIGFLAVLVQSAFSPKSNQAASLFFATANQELEQSIPKETILERTMPTRFYQPIENKRQQFMHAIRSCLPNCGAASRDESRRALLPH